VNWLPFAEFIANNYISEIIWVSPFFVNYKFNPLIRIKLLVPRILRIVNDARRIAKINNRIECIRETFEILKDNINKAIE
ncbi:hypothetical protein GE21DRAFT_1216569, partial [Neurospora crassa]